jgi:hypothetical protein
MWLTKILFAIFLILLSIIFFYGSLKFPMFTLFGGVGPGLLPLAESIILFVLAVYYLFTLLRKRIKVEERKVNFEVIRTPLLFAVILIMCLVFTKLFGMLLTMCLFSLITLRYLEKMKWLNSIVFSVTFIFGLFLIFERALSLNLPKGVFFSLLG